VNKSRYNRAAAIADCLAAERGGMLRIGLFSLF
jgi:hypothetical protein